MFRITGAIAQNWLADVPDDKRFRCCNGWVIKNLAELETALREMNDDSFRYHCNEAKCDFSNWVKDVIGDKKLARDLAKSTTREQAAKSVSLRIAWLQGKVSR